MNVKFKNSYMSYLLLYGFYYFAMAMFSSLISIYLMDLGLSAANVSLLISMSCLFSMAVQPVVGYLQDRYSGKAVTVCLLCVSGVFGLCFMFQREYLLLVFFYGITLSLLNGVNPYIERLATTSPYSYRSVRIWGTIGFASGSQLAGLVYENLSPSSVYLFFFVSILAAALGVSGAQEKAVDKAEDKEKTKASNGHWKSILSVRVFLFYLLVASMIYAVTNLNSTYLPVLLQEEGVSVSAISTVTFLQTLMELPIIFLSPYYMDRLTNSQLLRCLFALLAIQFSVYAFLPVPLVQMFASILTKAVVTMSFVMINLKVVSAIVKPQFQLSALTLVSALSKNLTTIIMQNIGGNLVDLFSTGTLYAILAGISVLGLVITILKKLPDHTGDAMFS